MIITTCPLFLWLRNGLPHHAHVTRVRIPEKAEPIFCSIEAEGAYLHCRHRCADLPNTTRFFAMVPSNQALPDWFTEEAKYICSVQHTRASHGPLVLTVHFYEVPAHDMP